MAAALEAPARRRDLLHDPRLWITVGLMAVLATGWLVAALLVGHHLSDSTVAFLPLGVFLIPVLYASVTFGLGGGMVLAIVSAAATVPWAMASLSRQDTLGAWSDLVQAVVLVLVAYFVGRAVRAERRSREVAELSRLDHLLAEVRYRDLFETNSQPILIADVGGMVHEANLAAHELFGRGGLGGATLAGLLGTDAAAAVLPGGSASADGGGASGRRRPARRLPPGRAGGGHRRAGDVPGGPPGRHRGRPPARAGARPTRPTSCAARRTSAAGSPRSCTTGRCRPWSTCAA